MENKLLSPTVPAMDADHIIIYRTDDGAAKVSLYANDGTVWMTQAQMAELFSKERSGISKHLSNIFSDGELDKKSNVKKIHIANADRPVIFYSLNVILAVGFRVHSPRGVQFRQWANTTLREFLQKGFVLDDERLKNPDGRPDHFDELLARIRDIRASEKRFYQKLRDLFALSSDYDGTDRGTQQFFAETQNKLIYGVTGMTAAELIVARADADQPNMALTSWKGGIVRTFGSVVSVDVDEYARTHFSKPVKKTLAIPAWLNDMATRQNINFSKTLQTALMRELGIDKA